MIIEAKIKLAGGLLLTAANKEKIIARNTIATDRSGNAIKQDANGNWISPCYGKCEPYHQTWKIFLSKEGYEFKEVSHGGGICGHARSVRELVIKTLCCGLFGPRENIIVEVVI